jgi:hypothetical protein
MSDVAREAGGSPEVDRAAYTAALSPTDQLKGYVPPPIARRADQLYDRLRERVRGATKGDLLAALVQGAPEDPNELAALLRAYEDTRVFQTLIGETRTTGLVELPARRPRGRPGGG